MNDHRIEANVVDVYNRRVFPGIVVVRDGMIAAIEPSDATPSTYLMPGFVDAHVHVESSMLLPAEFARAVTVHGTVATVSDPHEIGNVLGMQGVEYMLENAAHAPLEILFGAPSCVPATTFETAGAELDVDQVTQLLDDDRIGYLSEVMNFPGVLAGDPAVMGKIRAALERGKPVDGHAPGLRGDEARRYLAAGISTDHECATYEEAAEKLAAGCKILIREGSAARNFEALFPLIDEHPELCMFCTDDCHPDGLMAGHINALARRAVARGADVMNVLRCACINPVEHYRLGVGTLRVGDPADFVEVEDLASFQVVRTFLRGNVVAERGTPLIPRVETEAINRFEAAPVAADSLRVAAEGAKIRVIEAIDGELITNAREEAAKIVDGDAVADVERDLLKIAVVNRYRNAAPAVAFIQGFGMKDGAIASSVAHDSHNVVAVGADDADLCGAINAVIAAGGGISVCRGGDVEVLPLPVAGLMSTASYEEVAARYGALDEAVKGMGSGLRAPFMTLSFMALLVIPELKLSDLGLFDGERFELISLFVE